MHAPARQLSVKRLSVVGSSLPADQQPDAASFNWSAGTVVGWLP